MWSDRDRAARFFHLCLRITWWVYRATWSPNSLWCFHLLPCSSCCFSSWLINNLWKKSISIKTNLFIFSLDFHLNRHHLLTNETENVEMRHSTVCFHTTKLHPTKGCGLSYESEPNSQRRGDGEQIRDVTIWNTPTDWQQGPAPQGVRLGHCNSQPFEDCRLRSLKNAEKRN